MNCEWCDPNKCPLMNFIKSKEIIKTSEIKWNTKEEVDKLISDWLKKAWIKNCWSCLNKINKK